MRAGPAKWPLGVASILAAFSRSATMLIAARAVLGLAGATLAPSTLSLIRSMFHHPAQRTVAVGVWVSSYSAGAAVGPLLGGFLLERFWWGSVFLLGAPVMALLLLLGPRLLPEHRDPNPDRLDLAGAALSLLATLLVIYGLKQFGAGGPSWPPAFFVAMGAGLVGSLIPYLLPPKPWAAKREIERIRLGEVAGGPFVSYGFLF